MCKREHYDSNMRDSVSLEERGQLLGGPYAYKPEELVVVSQHLSLVLEELEAAGVAVDTKAIRHSSILDLDLVPLIDVDDAAKKLIASVVDPKSDPPERSLEQVLWALRQITAYQYAGWFPSIGKNRTVGMIHGVGEVSHGGGGYPEPISAKEEFNVPARALGPGRGVRIGVLDSALYPQPWLAGGWSAGYSDTVDRSKRARYSDGHATFVTGLILSQAPGATVDVHCVLEHDGKADSWDVAEEIVRFGQSGLDILNLSFVCYTEDGQPPLVLSTAVDRLPPDLVVVAAAGNHGEVQDPEPKSESEPTPKDQARKAGWPAALDDVIAVGAVVDATKKEAELAPFSPNAPWVDVLAPGVDLKSTFLPSACVEDDMEAEPMDFPDCWAIWSGTSFAAGLVSGAIAAAADPGRRSARSAAQDLFAALERSDAPRIGNTRAKVLNVPTF